MKPLLILLACVYISSAKDIPWELATARTTPGRNQPNKCSEFANALFKQMQANGVKSHVLVYTALPTVAQPIAEGYNMIYKGYEGHAVCIYWEGSEVWAMDNQMLRPRRVSIEQPKGRKPISMEEYVARQIAGVDRVIYFAYFADTIDPEKFDPAKSPIPGWEPGPNYHRIH